eukprot:m.13231 g.13231  ORF g.13231 m.13231 type:complete len:168 (+) comp8044_c0_seq1:872-1375(+)
MELGITIDAKLTQVEKAWLSMKVTESGITTDARPQWAKAWWPMLVTESGIIIDTKFKQWLKAVCPMDVIVLGINTDTRPAQSLKAPKAMPVRVSGIMTCPVAFGVIKHTPWVTWTTKSITTAANKKNLVDHIIGVMIGLGLVACQLIRQPTNPTPSVDPHLQSPWCP